MEQNEHTPNENGRLSFDKDNLDELMQEALWLKGGIYAHIPVGIEIYDVNGVLRAVNKHAMRIYGVEDRKSVIDVLNLFDSPHVDAKLKARICAGEEFTLDFEYDFERVNKDAYYASTHHATKVLEVKFVAIRNKQGELIGHLLLDSEVTSMKEAEFRTEESKKNLEMGQRMAELRDNRRPVGAKQEGGSGALHRYPL